MNTTKSTGLTAEEARSRLASAGPNHLFTPASVSVWAIAFAELKEPMILLLMVVGVFYGLWGGLGDTITIFVVIFLLVAVEVGGEFRAKRAIEGLERITAPKARVRRSGAVVMVDTETVVPGDALILAPGTRLAADAQLTAAVNFSVDESTLTGESLPVEKAATDTVFAGTVVVGGEGEAEITATGGKTRLGQLAAQLATVEPPKTPLQVAMSSLSVKLMWVALFFSVGIPLIGIARGGDVHQMILTGLSLAFAVIPEELPIIVTMVLALGAYRLSKEGFLVKRLRAAETLGDTTVILTDKTGTLTESRMQVSAVWLQGPSTPKAVIEAALGTVSAEAPDAMEQAMVANARLLDAAPPTGHALRLRQPGNGRRSKCVLWRYADGSLHAHLTGAPEEVLVRCREVSADIRTHLQAETALGRRVVAVATGVMGAQAEKMPFDDLERNLDLVGLVSLADPPRQGVKATLAEVANAGIRTLMVTGDHPATATAIAREVGIVADRVLTGEELDRLDDAALGQTVRDVSVFARATPQHKYRLVKALQKNGEVVVVTGDGVNDALALKAANVGVAMGIKGTDVAKDAAQAVLADDNYSTLARGVFEGRHFFDNLHKGVNYYLAVKVALVSIFLLPVLFGLPLPFAPIQIIVLEIFMDLAASAGFVAEPAEPNIARRRPRNTATALMDGAAARSIFFKGGLLFAAVMAAYAWATWRGLSPAAVQTCAFAAWMVGHVALAFISRSDRDRISHLGVFSNRVMNLWALAAIIFVLLGIYVPALREALHFDAVAPTDLLVCTALALLWVAPAELRKFMAKNTLKSDQAVLQKITQ
jgi:P-type Ca2+ transporter type 2C